MTEQEKKSDRTVVFTIVEHDGKDALNTFVTNMITSLLGGLWIKDQEKIDGKPRSTARYFTGITMCSMDKTELDPGEVVYKLMQYCTQLNEGEDLNEDSV